MSKGDWYRKVDQKKYDRGYLRVYGKECRVCHGTGIHAGDLCYTCRGVGYVERKPTDHPQEKA